MWLLLNFREIVDFRDTLILCGILKVYITELAVCFFLYSGGHSFFKGPKSLNTHSIDELNRITSL